MTGPSSRRQRSRSNLSAPPSCTGSACRPATTSAELARCTDRSMLSGRPNSAGASASGSSSMSRRYAAWLAPAGSAKSEAPPPPRRHDEVQVLEAQPVALGGALGQHLHGHLLLPAAHGQLVVAAAAHGAAAGELLQLLGRVGARRRDHQDGRRRVRLRRVQLGEVERRRADRVHAQHAADEAADGAHEPVAPQHLHQHDALEARRGAALQARREVALALGLTRPAAPHAVVVEVEPAHERRKGALQVAECVAPVRARPRREAAHVAAAAAPAGLGAGRLLAEEEVPLAVLEKVAVHAVHQVHAPHGARALEDGASDEHEHALLEHGRQPADALLDGGAVAHGLLERRAEQVEEAGQRELVHVVDVLEPADEEEERRAVARERPVHVALPVELLALLLA